MITSPTTTPASSNGIDFEPFESVERLNAQVRTLRSRARSLTAQADSLPEPLATTYRRRSSELLMEAHLIDNVSILRQS